MLGYEVQERRHGRWLLKPGDSAESVGFFRGVCGGRQHDNRDACEVRIPTLLQPEGPAVHYGHFEIEQDEAGIVTFTEDAQRVPPILD